MARVKTTPITLLPEIHTALASWPDEVPGRAHAEKAAAALRRHALAVLRASSSDGRAVPSRAAAEVLGVALSALQRWRGAGGCLSGIEP